MKTPKSQIPVPSEVGEVVRAQVQGTLATLYAQLIQVEAELAAWEDLKIADGGPDKTQQEAFGVERSRQVAAFTARADVLRGQIAALQATLGIGT
jgi:hypothetical protein